MDPRIRKVIDLMNENIRRRVSIDEMAQSVNLSPWWLCHLFKTNVGTSPGHYLHYLRLQRAKSLLETTFFSVKEIMNMVGIGDESHFVRDFEKAYGTSPTKFRKAAMEIDLPQVTRIERKIGQ